ncbi:MAG TPA: hypothetical protein VII67_07725 [Acidimicrobiales bacterium]
MAEVDLSGSRPVRVGTKSDRGHLHRMHRVIDEVQHSIVPTARRVHRCQGWPERFSNALRVVE